MAGKQRGSGVLFLVLITLIIVFGAAFALYGISGDAEQASAQIGAQAGGTQPARNDVPLKSGMEAHFLDVGQGDCELVICGGESLLIDAGEAAQADGIISYIKSLGITEFTYVIATHPHSDHIGGMAKIIDAFPVKNFIAPDVEHTSKTFENMLDALERNAVEITVPSPGDVFPLGGASFTVLSPPEKEYDNLNNYSIVAKMKYGDISILFTGDAEDVVEEELLKSGFDLESDILKVGHHGSRTSSTQKFLNAVSPRFAIISCALENSYGHPDEKTHERLVKIGAELYETRFNGTIKLITDGKTIAVTTQKQKE